MWMVLLASANAQVSNEGAWGTNLWQGGAAPNVLMMGNSYTFSSGGIDSRLRPMLEEGLEQEQVELLALSEPGKTLADHYGWAASDDHPWAEALDQGGWDFLVAQDQSQIPGFPQDEAYFQASAEGAVGLGELMQAQGGEIVFLMTWGRRDGDSTNSARYPDFTTMQARLQEGYLAYAELAGGTVAPVGSAWAVIHDDLLVQGLDPTQESAFTELYSGDGSHPSAVGSTLAAAVIYASLTGRSPMGLVQGFEQVDDAQRERLQDAAHRAVFGDVFGEIPLPFVWDQDQVEDAQGLVDHSKMWVQAELWDYSGPLEIGEHAIVQISGVFSGDEVLGSGALVLEGEWQISALPAQVAGSLEGSGTLLLEQTPSPGQVIVSEFRCGDLSALAVEGPDGPVSVEVDGCELLAEGDSIDGPKPDAEGCGCSGGTGAGGLIWLGVLVLGWRRRV
ncbi:MAG: hypothetical protein ACI9VR_000317 [Cognaticolwellia sp.]|jgi:hypothetical protein